ncbi:hypothetical protein H2O64_16790 [Kordia sp. YSTF-M3]|uniref:DUF4848 domain-containing protein n=1 Tax=Kordia aestuariivivens TaxID=2759037 RepID=A0ABR7QDC9_9FLAO|nr:hypothetical protein [Kordia aestuariivivens]MBC8756334.1 hypothetical protein [Kordia aestuariivivens]
MKKKMISFASLGLVCATFFLSCETENQHYEERLDAALEVPEKIISNAKAATLFQNDHTTRLSQIGKETTSFEEKSIYFDLQELTKYVNHLESVAVSRNIPITGASFVFGADANGKRTVFLMPSTRNASLDYQESFTIENGQFLTFKHIDQYLKVKPNSVTNENLILSSNGYLSFNEAVTLFNTYEINYIQPFAAKTPKEYYTKAVWYSLDEIKAYISYIKKKATDHDIAITGIDVFFGVYDTNPNLELKSNAQTLFLTASIQKHAIINTENELLKNYIQNGFFAKDDATDDEDESLAYNLGHLSPPPKNN